MHSHATGDDGSGVSSGGGESQPTVADASAIGASAGRKRTPQRASSASAGAVNPGRGGFFTQPESVSWKRCATTHLALSKVCAPLPSDDHGRMSTEWCACMSASRRRTLNAPSAAAAAR